MSFTLHSILCHAAGEWFCPRCRAELALDSSNEPLHSSLVPTRLMKQEDCYRSLAAALGVFSCPSPALGVYLVFVSGAFVKCRFSAASGVHLAAA